MLAAGGWEEVRSLAPVGADSELGLVNPGDGRWEQAALWGLFPTASAA